MLKCIIFDLGRVIVPFEFGRGYQQISALNGLTVDEIRARIAQDDLVIRYESGQIPSADFVAELGRRLDFNLSVEEFTSMWSAIFEPYTLIPESLPETLRANGYRVLLLSNTNDMHFNWIRPRYPILDHFDGYVLSHEVGALKPSPTIYAAAIEKSGVAPHECFFTDDIAAYIEGAKQAGMDAVQFESHDQIVEALRSRGVRV